MRMRTGNLHGRDGERPQNRRGPKKIKVVYHPEYPTRYFSGEGRIDLKLKNGKVLTGAMDQPYGGPKYPLSMDEVVAIYRKYLKGILSEKHIERTKDIILNLENEPDIKELADICTFGTWLNNQESFKQASELTNHATINVSRDRPMKAIIIRSPPYEKKRKEQGVR